MENGTKLRLLYLYQYLLENTSPERPQSTVELMRILKEKYGITVSRNTICNDLLLLRESELHIEYVESTQNKYYYDGQIFEVPELKILIDAVSSSKFITEQKSEALINKLLTQVPIHSAVKLRRHIYASDRVKSDNERGCVSGKSRHWQNNRGASPLEDIQTAWRVGKRSVGGS